MSSETRYHVPVKQMFRNWMKTLLDCGFRNINQMTYEPMHSAQPQSARVTVKIYFGFVGHHCRDITRSEDKSTFYHKILVKPYVLSYGQCIAR